jgi:tetratricopeptide (TPR) repeat protein
MSFFGKQIQKQFGPGWYSYPAYYLIVVALGLGSFLLNERRFARSRFLPFALLAVIWGVFMGYRQEFSAVFAAVLALNGQEWYHDRFGTEGRLGFNWTLWSTGGRLVTLAAIFFCVSAAITGWNKSPDEPRFGFTFDPNDFPFEAAEYLARRDDIKGNILNTTTAQGDALIWKAYPTRRSFIDSRDFFSREMLEEQRRLWVAIRDDDAAVWKEGLDHRDITAVMIEPSSSRETYARLSKSPNWIPFYDDGRVVIFGRGDAREPDLATFKANRLDPETRAFRGEHTVPPADRPPTPTTWVDDIFRNRLLGQRQSHTSSAARWLQGSSRDTAQPTLPDPARCLLAIQEARTAIAKNPDDWLAYRLLNASYRVLSQHESALLSGISLSQENQEQIGQIVPRIDLLNTRFRQRVTALTYAIATTPPPRSLEARRDLENLNLELYQLFRQAGFFDLARDRMLTVISQTQIGDVPSELVAQYHQQVDQLNERIRKIEDNLIDLQTERQGGPIEKAAVARRQGAPGMAIAELEEANRGNMSPAVVKPQLVDLYCMTGQPERALELFSMGAIEDPNLGTEPGVSFLRQGQVYLLLGNYQSAATLLQKWAIPKLRLELIARAISVGQSLKRGELVAATNIDLSIPPQIIRQATWLYELALCQLESGLPEKAAESFTHALKLAPEIAVRPIIAYYLEHLGKPVPELPKKAEKELRVPTSLLDRLDSTTPASELKPAPADTTKPAPADTTKPAPADATKPAPADATKQAPAREASKEKD